MLTCCYIVRENDPFHFTGSAEGYPRDAVSKDCSVGGQPMTKKMLKVKVGNNFAVV